MIGARLEDHAVGRLTVRWALLKVLLSRDPHHTLRAIIRHEMREHSDRFQRALDEAHR